MRRSLKLVRRPAQFFGRTYRGAPKSLAGSTPSSKRKYTGGIPQALSQEHTKFYEEVYQAPQVFGGSTSSSKREEVPRGTPSALPGAPRVLRGSPPTQAALRRLAPQPGAGGNNTGSEGAAWTKHQSDTLAPLQEGASSPQATGHRPPAGASPEMFLLGKARA